MQFHDILHIAKLSRLKLSAEEMETYPNQFKEIMKMINSIDEVNTENIEPMRHPFDARVDRSTMREDVPTSQPHFVLTTEADPYFYVPKVIE